MIKTVITRHINRRPPAWILQACIVAGMLGTVGIATPAAAQSQLRVRAISGLSFGSMTRMDMASINYFSNNAAIFEVTAEGGGDVLLKIDISEFSRADGPSDRRHMRLTILPELCAYSVDHGITWTPFAPQLLWQEVHLAAHGSGPATILVRAGGHVSAGPDQHRGAYTGSITLIATHK